MASDVDVCNLALANLGDDASVASIDPPEASVQAQYCARFYPVARNALLDMHDWSFATKRVSPAQAVSGITQWAYAYAPPADCQRVIAVLPPGSTDDYSAPVTSYSYQERNGTIYSEMPMIGAYQTQPYALETLSDGTLVVYTNQQEALIRYIARVTNADKFPPLFVTALSWLVSSYLAGPLLKGDVGQAEAKRCLQMFQMWLAKATYADAMQSNINPKHNVPWITGR